MISNEENVEEKYNDGSLYRSPSCYRFRTKDSIILSNNGKNELHFDAICLSTSLNIEIQQSTPSHMMSLENEKKIYNPLDERIAPEDRLDDEHDINIPLTQRGDYNLFANYNPLYHPILLTIHETMHETLYETF